MSISRREFFMGLGATIGMISLQGFLEQNTANAIEKTSVRDGKVGIEWLGHGSFLFTSCKGKSILLDPWISTNPKCPGKYRKKSGSMGIELFHQVRNPRTLRHISGSCSKQ